MSDPVGPRHIPHPWRSCCAACELSATASERCAVSYAGTVVQIDHRASSVKVLLPGAREWTSR